MDLTARLDAMEAAIKKPSFRQSSGKANEVNYWIFDYPPEKEIEVRDHLLNLVMPALAKNQPGIRAVAVNLFDLVISLLEERKLLDKAIEMQRTQGDEKTLKSLRSVLKEDKLAERMVAQYNIAELDLLLLWNVGGVYPMLRTHTLLSALHAHMKDTPLVMFYPGNYDGYSLRLFSKLKDDHYYRAFRLVS